VLTVYFLIISITAFLLLVLASVVLIRNSKTELNKSFAVFTTSVAGWVFSNYFCDVESIPIEYVILANHITLLFACVSLIVLSHFLLAFVPSRLSEARNKITTASILLALISLTSFVIKDVTFDNGVSVIEFGPLAPVYFGVLSFSIGVIFYSLITGLRNKRGVEHRQVKVIFMGALITVGLSSITNALLPAAFGVYTLISIGPLSTLALIYALFYTITKHKLFDIRLIVARSLGYILSLGILILTFVFTSSLLVENVFRNVNEGWVTTFINSVIFLAAVLTYPVLKRYFDRITNKVFYRDAYDPQDFLDNLNTEIVQNIEMDILLRRVSSVIEEHIKCSYCFVGVFETDKTPLRIIGAENPQITKTDMLELRSELAKSHQKVILTDDLGSHFSSLKNTLSKKDAGMVVRIVSGKDLENNTLAYLVLGIKKSGNVYNKQDVKIVEIIADELVIAIQNALRFEEIQSFAATLQEKVNTATLKLQKTNKKLRDLDETKDEFISMASHQLRTPLTSVKGYTSMVLEGDAGKLNKAQKDLLNQAFVSSQRMVYLIADLLNVSRLKTGKFIIDAQPTNLAEVVEGEILQLQETAKRKNLTLTYDKPKNFPELMLDETKIRQVIMNFADNAIYYTPRGGKVDIELKKDSSSVYFTVKDDGIGVPKKEQEHMFTKFYRATNARKSRPDGTGLGLFMAKKVVDAQGGHILFESHEGKGSTFGFCFKKKSLSVKGAHSNS
jgi:signal transduction histidine kinase